MSNILVSRYADLNCTDLIRRKSRLEVEPLTDLNSDTVESACLRMKKAWNSTFVPTKAVVEALRVLIEWAQGHASMYYPRPQSILTYGYCQNMDFEPYMPYCLTGPAGTGKSQLQTALMRLLTSKPHLLKLDGHLPIELISFTRIQVNVHRSVSQVIRPLCRPEIATGSGRVTEANMARDCATWRYLHGACLFGVDEMQFIAQSSQASTLITKILLALMGLGTPWFFCANYSMCWKLLARPPEATQRLMSRPLLLMPDAPGTACWEEVLAAYQRTVPNLFGFEFKDRRFELWNYTAGVKRELVSLLTHAYRHCRSRSAWQVRWEDVERAYGSVEYAKARGDVSLLISHATQGGALPKGLMCPFFKEANDVAGEGFKMALRNARSSRFVAAATDSAMTASERSALMSISAANGEPSAKPTSNGEKRTRSPKSTVTSLQEAARRFKENQQP